MKERDGPKKNIFKGLTVDGKVIVVYDDYFVTHAKGPDGQEYSVTVTNSVWSKVTEGKPLPLKGDVISLGDVRFPNTQGYRSHNPQPKL